MKHFLFICLCLLGLGATAQTSHRPQLRFVLDQEGKLKAVPVLQTAYDIQIPEISYKLYTPENISLKLINIEQQTFKPAELPAMSERPMDMNILSEAYRPFFNVYTPMLRRVSPMALDFDEYAAYPVGVNSGLILNGRQFTWPGSGGTTTLEAAFAWTNERLTLTAGAFGGRYYTPYSIAPGFIGGINASARYEVNDWMALRGWGQYAYSDNNGVDPFLQLNPMLNQTNLGGAVEFKLGDEVGFGIGINYQYNHFNNRMERQYLFYPAIGGRNSRIKIGAW